MREQFEKWVGHALPHTALSVRINGRYTDPTIEILWQAWQESWHTALIQRDSRVAL